MATRTSADIQSTEDYVDLVMKPGEGISSVSHQEASQRHQTPEQFMFRNKKKTGWRDGISQNDEAEVRSNEKLLNFDNKWQNLFKFPKGNKTVDSSVPRNLTLKNETGLSKEIASNKMLEVESNAKSLAKMIEDGSSRNAIDPAKIKEAAKNLEDQVETLQDEVLQTFANESVAIEKEKEEGKDKSSLQKDKKEKDEKKFSKEKNKNCTDCGTKVPKPGDPADNSTLVPKLKKGGDNNGTSSAFDANNTVKDDPSEKKVENEKAKNVENGQKETKKKVDEDKEDKDQRDNGEKKTKGEAESNSDSKKNPKKGTKTAALDKGKHCKDCGTKIPKVGNKTDDGKLAVPKLTGDNDTTVANGFKQGQAALEKQKEVKTNDKGAGKSASDNKEATMKAEKKPCKNCGGKIAKPGNKTDDGKLIVPKLSKTNTNSSQNAYQNALANEKLILQNVQVDKEESFDLDDDAQEITEDADYAELSSSKYAGSKNKTSESQIREGEASQKTVGQSTGNGDSGSSAEREEQRNKELADSEKESRQNQEENKSMEGLNNTKSGATQVGNEKEQNGNKTNKEVRLNGDKQDEKKPDASSKVDDKSDTKKEDSNDQAGDNSSEMKTSEQADEAKGRNKEVNGSKVSDKESVGNKNMTEEAKLKKETDLKDYSVDRVKNQNMKTVKQFSDLLKIVLKNTTTEQKEELLKLTWHDLRARHTKEKMNEQKDKVKSNSAGDGNFSNSSGLRHKPGGSVKPEVKSPTEESTPSKSGDNGGYKTIVGRIKEKISLLKDLIELNKRREAKKNSTAYDPYQGFKRAKVRDNR
eukprot:gene15201-6403_t